MGDNFILFLKKHWVIVLILIAVPIAFITVFALSDRMQITSADWIVLSGAVLTYIGTTFVSAVALYQSEKANQLSEKVLQLNEREYFTVFSIESVVEVAPHQCNYNEDSDSSRILTDRIFFCAVDLTPERCQGYQISIKNCSNYPITHLSVSTTYPIGRAKQHETLEKDTEIMIPPSGSHDYLLCNTPYFCCNYCGEVLFKLTCRNVFGYSSTMELKIKDAHSRNKEERVQYTCKLLSGDDLKR